MEDKGSKVTLCSSRHSEGYQALRTAQRFRYIAPKSDHVALGSNFSEVEFDGNIDFTNPEAVAWYQLLLAKLLKLGVAAIKTDFGEVIEEHVSYFGLPYHKLHNLYALLYQKAAYEITRKVKGPQRQYLGEGWWTSDANAYPNPLEWGWLFLDGMACSLRGGCI